MLARSLGVAFLFGLPLLAQQVCQPVPIYAPCDIVFELNDQEAAAHPNPYISVDLRAEIRSPRARTVLMPAFWAGGRKMIIRFAPVDPGTWDFKITGNIERFNGKLGQAQVTESADPGFLLPANVHHWMTSETRKAHLWMGDSRMDFATEPQAAFDAYLEARAKQKFNHVRGLVLHPPAFQGPDKPNPEFFDQLDKRVAALNAKGIFTDLVLARNGAEFIRLFDGWQNRDRFIRYIASRYSAYHITWQLLGEFESAANGRALLKELGGLLQKHDPYKHPRATGTIATSGPVLPDGWQNFVVHHSADDAIGAIEHQIHPAPFVNTGFSDDSTAPDEFRRRLWRATMNGQYPHTSIKAPDSPNAKAMSDWFEFMSQNRYWELEPHFDIDGARAVALPGVEYIIYIEKWGTVEILIEKHGYDVFWMNLATGELTKEKKDFKGEKWVGEPPSKTGEWVLRLSREGRKEGMLRSYKFESRPNLMQEIEQNPAKMPWDFLAPTAEQLSTAKPPGCGVKIKRETRGTRAMLYLWTGEVPTEGRGYRVLATGAEGTLNMPRNLASNFPAVFNLRLYALNAVGKVYAMDKVYRLTE